MIVNWVKILLPLAIPVAAGIAAYGALGERVKGAEHHLEAIDHRFDASEIREEAREAYQRHSLEKLREILESARIDIAKICAKVRCEK